VCVASTFHPGEMSIKFCSLQDGRTNEGIETVAQEVISVRIYICIYINCQRLRNEARGTIFRSKSSL